MVFCLPALLGLLLAVPSALGDTATARVGATIVEAASLQTSAALSWGQVTPGPAGGLVTLAPGGTRLLRGDLAERGGLLRAACLRLATPTGAAYSLLLPASVTLRGPAGAPAMLADSFVLRAGGAGLPAGGAAVVYIGATAHIGPNQAPGLYCGDLPVSLCYH